MKVLTMVSTGRDGGGRFVPVALSRIAYDLAAPLRYGLTAKGGASVDAAGFEALGLAKREARELLDKLAASGVPDFELDLAKARPPEEFAERFAAAVPKVDKPPSE